MKQYDKTKECEECGNRNRDKNFHCATQGCHAKKQSKHRFLKRGLRLEDFDRWWKAKVLKNTHIDMYCPKCKCVQTFTAHDRRCLNFKQHTA